jgi:Zn-dependent peptidase ImmA (M78 family)
VTVLASLRSVVPIRPLNRGESMRVAELQANKLLEVSRITDPPVPEEAIAQVPRIQVDRMSPMPVSGSAHWSKGRWIVVVNGAEPLVRQRFSLAHEFKHVLDAPFITFLYLDARGVTSAERGEQVADYFAGCLLMPRMWVKRLWASGVQELPALSRRFGVSQAAMQVRLMQIGLAGPSPRCPRQPPSTSSNPRRRLFFR